MHRGNRRLSLWSPAQKWLESHKFCFLSTDQRLTRCHHKQLGGGSNTPEKVQLEQSTAKLCLFKLLLAISCCNKFSHYPWFHQKHKCFVWEQKPFTLYLDGGPNIPLTVMRRICLVSFLTTMCWVFTAGVGAAGSPLAPRSPRWWAQSSRRQHDCSGFPQHPKCSHCPRSPYCSHPSLDTHTQTTHTQKHTRIIMTFNRNVFRATQTSQSPFLSLTKLIPYSPHLTLVSLTWSLTHLIIFIVGHQTEQNSIDTDISCHMWKDTHLSFLQFYMWSLRNIL